MGGAAERLAFQICLIHAVRGLRDSREDLAPSAPGSHCGRNSPARIRTAGMQLAGSSSHALGESGGSGPHAGEYGYNRPWGGCAALPFLYTSGAGVGDTTAGGWAMTLQRSAPTAGVAHGAMPAQSAAPVRERLTKDAPVVRDLRGRTGCGPYSLDLTAGDIVVVSGLPGSGKSTLIRRAVQGRAIDSQNTRDSWAAALPGLLPYALYRPLVRAAHYLGLWNALRSGESVVVHDCGTQTWVRHAARPARREPGPHAPSDPARRDARGRAAGAARAWTRGLRLRLRPPPARGRPAAPRHRTGAAAHAAAPPRCCWTARPRGRSAGSPSRPPRLPPPADG